MALWGIGIRMRKAQPKDEKFEYFKRLIMTHLSELEKEEAGDKENLRKALIHAESMIKGGMPVGTIRTWKGKKYVKVAPGKWRPKYDSESRGAKMAIAAIKKKIASAKDSRELMQIVLENRSRFSDKEGHPLPFIQELSQYVSDMDDAFAAVRKRGENADRKPPKQPEAPKKESQGKPPEFKYQKGDGVFYDGEYGKITGSYLGDDGRKIYHTEFDDGSTADVFEEDIASEKTKSGQTAAGKEKEGEEVSIETIRKKYQSAKAIEGDEDEIQVGKDVISGKWRLVEADTPTASHDERTFHKTPGFPTNADGSTINGRDYGHDRSAQEAVNNIASDFDGRALKFDNPVIVTKDGIVISGNNRTMSSKIAARRGTDEKYIEALKKRAKKFGFTGEQVSRFKNPRVIFETEQSGDYSTATFAKFNESGKKEMGPTERAVKVSKLIKTETVQAIARRIGEFDTLGDKYADREASVKIIGDFLDAGLIAQNEGARYWENGSVTEDGKTFIETALLGSVMSEANIRGFNRPGCKSIRQMLVRAILPLIENKGMEGYSINKELNQAVDIAMQVAIERDKFKNVSDFSKQKNMFENLDPVAVELAKKLEGTQKGFAEFMQTMNGGLKYAANGECDIFIGGVESREDILSRFLDLKKAVTAVLQSIPRADLLESFSRLRE